MKLLVLFVAMILAAACSACDPVMDDPKPRWEGSGKRIDTILDEGVTLSIAGDDLRDTNWPMAVASYEKAIAKFREAMAIDSTFHPAITMLAHTYYMANRYRDAIECYDRALALRPDFAAGYHERGMAYLNLGWSRQGEASIRKALELDSSDEYRHVAAGDLGNLSDWFFAMSSKAPGDSLRASWQRLSMFARLLAVAVSPDDTALARSIPERFRAIGDTAAAERFEWHRKGSIPSASR